MTTQEQKAVIGDLYIRLKELQREEGCLLSKVKDASKTFKLAHTKIQEMIEEKSFEFPLESFPSHQEIEKLCQRLFGNQEEQKDIQGRLDSY